MGNFEGSAGAVVIPRQELLRSLRAGPLVAGHLGADLALMRGPTQGARRAGGGQLVGFWLGMIVAPFTRAALVIEIDPQVADFPEFWVVQALAGSTSQVGMRSSTWVVPTRRPDRLHAAIEQVTNSPAWNSR
jgi:hypothetical protein